jgi:hypothetical protein
MKEAVVECCAMFSGTAEPGGDSRVAIAKHSHGGGHREAFGQCCQYLSDALGCCLAAVQRRGAPRTKGGLACLAAQGLDTFAFSVSTVTDHCMDLGIGDPIIVARAIRAGEALSVDAFGGAATTFEGAPGRHQGAGLQQAPEGGADSGSAPAEKLTPPGPGRVGQEHNQSKPEPVRIGEHTGPCATHSRYRGVRRKDTEDDKGCQAFRKSMLDYWRPACCPELSTTKRGSTTRTLNGIAGRSYACAHAHRGESGSVPGDRRLYRHGQ